MASGKMERRSSGPPESPAARGVWNVRDRLEENFGRVETLLQEMETESDSKMRLAAAAELRRHIAEARGTLDIASRTDAVRAFEQIVISALEAASITVRRRVMDALNARASEDVAAGVLRETEREVLE